MMARLGRNSIWRKNVKVGSNVANTSGFHTPNERSGTTAATGGMELPSQTKILEGGTKDEIRISKEALFKGVSTRFGQLTIEKSVENPDFIFCSSFRNLRLGSIKW
jgi:hypothetical protein